MLGQNDAFLMVRDMSYSLPHSSTGYPETSETGHGVHRFVLYIQAEKRSPDIAQKILEALKEQELAEECLCIMAYPQNEEHGEIYEIPLQIRRVTNPALL